jgi:hypothetical protein
MIMEVSVNAIQQRHVLKPYTYRLLTIINVTYSQTAFQVIAIRCFKLNNNMMTCLIVKVGAERPNPNQACEHYSIMRLPLTPDSTQLTYKDHPMGPVGVAISGMK